MKATLFCFHGWGGTAASFTELRKALADSGIEIITPNLPGFGGEPEPKTPWTNDDFAQWAEECIRSKLEARSSKLFLLGHSHGGRICIKLATRNTLAIDHLFLCAPAGIKHPRHIKRAIGLTLAKSGKFFLSVPLLNKLRPIAKKLLYRLVRVHDYEQASTVMRQTLINITKEDLRPLLKNINVQTDIFWGEDDTMTPYADAAIFREFIPHNTLFSYKSARHRVHRDRAEDIANVIQSRL